jgi:hypothetical protein
MARSAATRRAAEEMKRAPVPVLLAFAAAIGIASRRYREFHSLPYRCVSKALGEGLSNRNDWRVGWIVSRAILKGKFHLDHGLCMKASELGYKSDAAAEFEGAPLLRDEYDMLLADTLDQLAAEIRPWQDATFPQATPQSCANHLLSEARELAANPTDPAEMADVFLLLVGVANKAGVDLAEAVRAKFDVCKGRKWGEPNAEGFVEHVREEPGQ